MPRDDKDQPQSNEPVASTEPTRPAKSNAPDRDDDGTVWPLDILKRREVAAAYGYGSEVIVGAMLAARKTEATKTELRRYIDEFLNTKV